LKIVTSLVSLKGEQISPRPPRDLIFGFKGKGRFQRLHWALPTMIAFISQVKGMRVLPIITNIQGREK
jgi:hypothetical protein